MAVDHGYQKRARLVTPGDLIDVRARRDQKSGGIAVALTRRVVQRGEAALFADLLSGGQRFDRRLTWLFRLRGVRVG